MTALDMEHEVSSVEIFHHKKEIFLENEIRQILGVEKMKIKKRKENISVRVFSRKQLIFQVPNLCSLFSKPVFILITLISMNSINKHCEAT